MDVVVVEEGARIRAVVVSGVGVEGAKAVEGPAAPQVINVLSERINVSVSPPLQSYPLY